MDTLFMRHASETDLRRGSLPVTDFTPQLQSDIDRLIAVMARTGALSLSAPQLGLYERILAIDLRGGGRSPIVIVNPALASLSTERQIDREGCESLAGISALVSRSVHLVVEGVARSGQRVRLEAGGMLARLVQHQMDHLNGILLLDYLPLGARTLIAERGLPAAATCRLAHAVG